MRFVAVVFLLFVTEIRLEPFQSLIVLRLSHCVYVRKFLNVNIHVFIVVKDRILAGRLALQILFFTVVLWAFVCASFVSKTTFAVIYFHKDKVWHENKTNTLCISHRKESSIYSATDQFNCIHTEGWIILFVFFFSKKRI